MPLPARFPAVAPRTRRVVRARAAWPLLVLLGLTLLVLSGCAGCGGTPPPSEEDRARETVSAFVNALTEQRRDDALALCTPEAATTVEAGLDGFVERAEEIILAKPIDDTDRTQAPRRLREAFEQLGVIRAATVKSVTITAPGQATADVVWITPSIYRIAGVVLQEAEGPKEEMVALIHRAVQLRQQTGAEGEAPVWKVSGFDPLSLLDVTACPNYLVHRFLELAKEQDFEEEFYDLFIQQPKQGERETVREAVKSQLLNWNERNHALLTEIVQPLMEKVKQKLDSGDVPAAQLEELQRRYDEGKEMLDMLIQYLPEWELQVVSQYQVRATAWPPKVRPDNAREALVLTVARMPSFMPHRLGPGMIFEKSIREQPIEVFCARTPDGSWRIAANPFDLRMNWMSAQRRAQGSDDPLAGFGDN